MKGLARYAPLGARDTTRDVRADTLVTKVISTLVIVITGDFDERALSSITLVQSAGVVVIAERFG